ALIFLQDGEQLRQVHHRGRLPIPGLIGDSFPITRGFVGGRAFLERRTIHVRDLAKALARGAYPDTKARVSRRVVVNARTIVASPLLVGGKPDGVIIVRRRQIKPFTARELALTRAFAEHAALAVAHARP